MKKVLFDFGSNSTKLWIFNHNDNKIETVLETLIVNRLAKGLKKNNFITNESKESLFQTIEKFLKISQQNSVEEVLAIGTMALRVAENSGEIIKEIKEKYNFDVDVLSGNQEAYYSFKASSMLAISEQCCVIDSGGGSTEFVFGKDNTITYSKSINIGAVKPTEMFHKKNRVSAKEILEMAAYIREEISQVNTAFKGKLIGVGGTITTISSIIKKIEKYKSKNIHGSIITYKQLEDTLKLLELKSIEERKSIIGLHPDRADVIFAGAMIYLEIMKKFKTNEIIVSSYGVRQGYIADKLGG